jgi:hypothetical protein
MLSNDLTRHVGKYYGKYAGIVADDPAPDAQGTILVVVPGVINAVTPVRARPCLPFGHFFIPAPATRIWVEFEGGNTNYPLWVGVWYPQDTAPQEVRSQPQTHRVIQTPKGHTIELSDEDDAEKIIIRHKDNSFIALQADGSVLVSNKQGAFLFLNADNGETTLTSKQGHLVSMNDQGMMLVNDGGAVIELKGTTVTVLAENIAMGGTNVALGANATDPTIMGNAFKIFWALVQNHVHPTAMGPSGPSPMLMPLELMPGVHLTSSVTVK